MAPKAPKISVIMPAYNVEGYVQRAVESLQQQTLTNFELLVVDDGSTDRTGAILDALEMRDTRITVFHTPNAGAPAARNFALDKARGSFVMFMDADDWADNHMLEDMYTYAVKHGLELVISGFYIDTYYGRDNQFTTEIKHCKTKVFSSRDEFRLLAYRLFDENQLYTPWNKLFLRERIEAIHARFRNTFWDDFPFVLDYIRDCEKVGVLSQPYYHFIRARKESETARWRKDMYQKREEEHAWMCDLYQHWNLHDEPHAFEMIQRRYIERLIGCIENVCNPACTLSVPQKLQHIKDMISTSQAQKAVMFAHPRSKMMELMLVPIRRKNARLCYQEGKFISFVKRHNAHLFALLKARR